MVIDVILGLNIGNKIILRKNRTGRVFTKNIHRCTGGGNIGAIKRGDGKGSLRNALVQIKQS